MSDTSALLPACSAVRRPQELLSTSAAAHGLRAAQAGGSGASRFVDVWLYRDPPAGLADPARWLLRPAPGGAPVTITKAEEVAGPPKRLKLTLSGTPDTARYRLEVTPPSAAPFDPLRTWLPVRLRPECADLGSCFDTPDPPAAPRPGPAVDYTARDWRSLRRALTEFLVAEDPEADLSLADPTITAIELFAHVGDLLHYRLDRVATEAYLETARTRTSVKRHARLVDYRVGDGTAARTFVHLSVDRKVTAVNIPAGHIACDAPGSALAFTIDTPVKVQDALGEIAVYDWGEPGCCLPAGATECVLVRPKPADPLDPWLAPGALIAFELVDPVDPAAHQKWCRRIDEWPPVPVTVPPAKPIQFRAPLPGRPAQIVELEAVEEITDPLADAVAAPGMKLFRVRWRGEDALRNPFPVAVDDASGIEQVTVVRGNIARAHHGRMVDGPPGATLRPRRREGETASAAVSAYELLACGPPGAGGRGGPGLSLAEDGRPHGMKVRVKLPSGLGLEPDILTNLLDADPGSLAAVVDVEEHEPPLLRFRTGALGFAPPAGSNVAAAYEVGGGSSGNVPAGALTTLESNTAVAEAAPVWKPVAGVRVRNPVPATGGADPEPLDTVRRDAPEAFAAVARRAVLPSDHATTALATGLVQRATAQPGWTGSWPLVRTLVDLHEEGRATDMPAIQASVDSVRMLGTEAVALEARVVGLLLALDICITPGAESTLVRNQALALLRPGDDERPGVFHRSHLELGSEVYVSSAVAAVSALPQVDAILVREARRLDDAKGTVKPVITVAADEVAALDDDPARPERGRLDIRVRGGR